MTKENYLNADKLRNLLDYNSRTGDFTWREAQGPRAKKGAKAGACNVQGYRVIKVGDYQYFEHRLAYLHVRGEWPTGRVTHDNCNRADNRWENLIEL
jgi:hypothetical protein